MIDINKPVQISDKWRNFFKATSNNCCILFTLFIVKRINRMYFNNKEENLHG